MGSVLRPTASDAGACGEIWLPRLPEWVASYQTPGGGGQKKERWPALSPTDATDINSDPLSHMPLPGVEADARPEV